MAQLRQDPLDPGTLESLRKHCENARDPETWAEALEHHARAANAADADPMDLADPGAAQRRKVEAAIDAVRAKLGKGSIGKGRGIEIKRR